MRVETRVTIIPAQTRTLTVYVAHDGREFFDPDLCEAYEKTLDMMKSHVFKTCVNNVTTLDEDVATLYNIRNNEDHICLLASFSESQLEHFSDQYSTFGPGWYIHFVTDGGDSPNQHHLYNYVDYVNSIEDKIARWKEELELRMSSALK